MMYLPLCFSLLLSYNHGDDVVSLLPNANTIHIPYCSASQFIFNTIKHLLVSSLNSLGEEIFFLDLFFG